MTPNKWIAVAVVSALIIIGNAYSGIVLWTFHYGEAATATIAECDYSHSESSTEVTCHGRWVDGSDLPREGAIAGARPGDEELPIRVGPFGAYTDNASTMWWRMWPALLVDGAMALGIILFPLAWATGRRTVRHMRAEASPGAQVWAVTAKRVVDESGTLMTVTRYTRDAADLRVVDQPSASATQHHPEFHCVRYQLDTGYHCIRVTSGDGTAIGSVRQEDKTRYGVYNHADEQVGHGESVSGDKGERHEFTAVNGSPMGTIALTMPVVVRTEPAVDTDTRLLLLAFGVGHLWFTTVGPRRKPSRGGNPRSSEV